MRNQRQATKNLNEFPTGADKHLEPYDHLGRLLGKVNPQTGIVIGERIIGRTLK